MYNAPPNWPAPSAPTPGPGGGGRAPQSRRPLILAIVTGVLIVALVGAFLFILTSIMQGGGPGGLANNNGQSGQATATTGQQATLVDGAPTVVATATTGTTAAPTPTNTPPSASASPTPTSPIIICCLVILPTIHQVLHQVTLPPSNAGPVTVSCPAGELALSGGWATNQTSGADINNSSRYGTSGWQIYVNSHPASLLVNVYAECLKNASGATIVERSQAMTIPAGGTNSVRPACNAGEVAVGGGYAANIGVELFNFSPNSSTEWLIYAKNYGVSPSLLNAYVECLTYTGAHTSTTLYKQTTVSAGGSGGVASNACPSGMAAAGGGYATSLGGFVYTMLAGSSNTAWSVFIYANQGHDELLNSYALCLGF